MSKSWVQIATIVSTLTAATAAAAQEVVTYPPAPVADVPVTAPAPEPLAVGGEGRWVFDLLGGQLGSNGVGPLGFVGPFAFTTTSMESDLPLGRTTIKATLLELSPSADLFVTERFSVGGRVDAGLLSTSTHEPIAPIGPGDPKPAPFVLHQHGYTIGIAPRVGYAIPISSSVAFWPRLGVGYESSRQTYDEGDARTLVRTYSVESILGVGIRVSKHALFDLGPVLRYRHQTSEGGLATLFGVPQNGMTNSFDASLRASLRVDF